MSWIKNYKTKRRGSRNFTHETANKRIVEAVESHNASIENALRVQAHEVFIYKSQNKGRPCSCRVTLDENVYSEEQEQRPEDFSSTVDDTTLFGENNYRTLDEQEASIVLEAGDMLAGREVEEDVPELIQRPIDTAVKCGICYRQGFSPAFESIGGNYQVFTSYDIVDVEDGFATAQAAQPVQMVKVSEGGRVYFELTVPKYFKKCHASIRDNTDVLTDLPKYELNGEVKELSMSALNSMRGGYLKFFVDVEEFTHVVFFFDLGVEPILANLSAEGQTLDFNTLDTIGSMSVALPNNVGHVKPRDLIFVPSHNIALRVTDAPKKQLVGRQTLEWLVSCRVLQPQEDLKHFMDAREIL